MSMTADVTILTNRVDLFAAAHGISPRQLVEWNLGRFHERPWFWLRPGEELRIAPPPAATGIGLVVDGDLLEADGAILLVDVI